MKNHRITLKNHVNQPKTMKTHETTLKNHGNQPKTGYLPNFAILFLFSKSSFWYGFYLKNENEKFLFYLKYKENMCGSWFASQFTPPIPPPTNQPNAEIWHINVSVPKTKRWIIQIKNFHFCYQKNKTKHNSIFSKCKKVNQLMHFIFTKSTK